MAENSVALMELEAEAKVGAGHHETPSQLGSPKLPYNGLISPSITRAYHPVKKLMP